MSGDGYLGDLPELHQGCQVPFCISRGNMGFLLRHCSGKGPHLALREESRGCSQVAARSNPGDSNTGEANPGDSPHSAASVVSSPGQFSGHLAHILYACSCTQAHTHTHTHTEALFFFRAQETLTSSQHVKTCSGKPGKSDSRQFAPFSKSDPDRS